MLHPGWLELHSPPALPSPVHSPIIPVGHAMLGQEIAGLVQDTSQLHDAAQSIVRHASVPEQLILHLLVPQWRLSHAIALEHWMSQLCACAQSTTPHEPLLLHRIVQS